MSNDFSQGKVWKNVINQAIPLMVAQLIQILYNVVDRIYIGRLPVIGSNALTGIGLVFPITTLVAAFTNLFSTGGVPLFSMARGAKEEKKAELILGQVVSLLTITSIVLMVLCYIFKRPVLFIFGASEETYVYADQYLKIYLLGTMFSVLSTGLNGFINAQGYPQKGMMTVMLGAVINLILDPIFIYGLHMGVYGAAIATVISQGVSFVWVVSFFIGKKTFYHIKKEKVHTNFLSIMYNLNHKKRDDLELGKEIYMKKKLPHRRRFAAPWQPSTGQWSQDRRHPRPPDCRSGSGGSSPPARRPAHCRLAGTHTRSRRRTSQGPWPEAA